MRKAGKTIRSKKQESSVVPVLFTLGIIGWGFFAIDRLTKPLAVSAKDDMIAIQEEEPKSFRSYSNERNTNNFTEKIKNWAKKLVEAKNQELNSKSNKLKENQNIPVISETKLSKSLEKNNISDLNIEQDTFDIQIEEDADFDSENNLENIENFDNINNNIHEKIKKIIKLYYFEYKNDKLSFYQIERKIENKDDNLLYKKTFEALLAGPSQNELSKEHINSFLNTPKILNVCKENNILILDFDENFGSGLSFEMLKYQISQLLKTAIQFKGIDSIQIKIKGKQVNHLEGDGLILPSVIKEENWLI
ncbi:MAG: GerMN domain-containing protein [Spirochaetia bacterium]|nr:GerMN domain-containing protein [Spirochaetia bacterium]